MVDTGLLTKLVVVFMNHITMNHEKIYKKLIHGKKNPEIIDLTDFRMLEKANTIHIKCWN